METDSQTRIGFGELDRFFKPLAVRHQAGRGDNPFLMGFDDALVNRGGPAEVVGIHYQFLQRIPFSIMTSAICTALSAAPLRSWSPATKSAMDLPEGSLASCRMRPTKTWSCP